MKIKILSAILVLFLSQVKVSANSFAPVAAFPDSFDIKIELYQKYVESIKNGDLEKISKYIKNGWGINSRFISGTTYLIEAIQYKQPEIITYLLNYGADPNLRSAEFKDVNDNWIPEDSPLEMAIVFDSDYSTAALLLKHGANINDTIEHYGTVLHEVISGAGDKMSSDLYTENQNTNKFSKNQAAALEKVKWLINHGANPNATNSFGDTPIYNAVNFRYFDIVDFLIDHGASTNINRNNGKTLLHLTESPALVLKLIKLGADVNARTNEEGLTPLHMAAFSGNLEKMKILVENGADVNIKDYDSHLTPLDWLIVEGFTHDMAKLLISHGATVREDLAVQYGLKDEIDKIKKELKM